MYGVCLASGECVLSLPHRTKQVVLPFLSLPGKVKSPVSCNAEYAAGAPPKLPVERRCTLRLGLRPY